MAGEFQPEHLGSVMCEEDELTWETSKWKLHLPTLPKKV